MARWRRKAESGAPEDKFVSFAYSAAPPGTSGALHWLRATYQEVSDAMPTRFEAKAGTKDTYFLRNVWPAYCPGGVCPSSYGGYVCAVAEVGGGYTFLHTSCTLEQALPLKVNRLTDGEYVLQTLQGEYVSFCDGGCSGQRIQSLIVHPVPSLWSTHGRSQLESFHVCRMYDVVHSSTLR